MVRALSFRHTADMPTPFVAAPSCAECGQAASHVELVGPVAPEAPAWRFVYSGPGGSNGSGDVITEDRAERLTEAFVEPFQQFGLAVLRKRLQEFDQKAPMRKKTTFQRKGERRCGLLRIFLRHFNSYVPSRKRISGRSCSLGSGIA